MKKINVIIENPSDEKNHSCFIGGSILHRALSKYNAPSKKAVIVADKKLTAYRDQLSQYLKELNFEVLVISVPASETFKSIEQILPVYQKMLKWGADRMTTLFALGGGTVGDAAGFIAATYLRGINWVSIPTTLLAQVDSGLGGKTGVNHPAGKNLLGSIYQPKMIIVDTQFLKTLSPRDVISGLGEILKYALSFDAKWFEQIEKNWKTFLQLPERLTDQWVNKSLTQKAFTIRHDELDLLGKREVLNFGHTLGHALEKTMGYGVIRHGEAVLIGMQAAVELSYLKGHLKIEVRDRIHRLLCEMPKPKWNNKVTIESLIKATKNDKKSRQGKIHFVLLSDIGKTISDNSVTVDEIKKSILYIQKIDKSGRRKSP